MTEKTNPDRTRWAEIRELAAGQAEDAADITGDLRIPILVVEDTDDDWELLDVALRQLPVAPTRVRTLREAIAHAVAGSWACVLVDLTLPDSVGLATVRALVQHHDAIVVLTGQGEAFALEAIQAGADDYLRKGASTVGEVRRAVMCAIARRKRRRAG